jgi:tetratricopeptide (TPR) repeat protein
MRTQRFVNSLFVTSILSVVFLPSVVAQTKSHPVTGSELIALVASESLDQNIVHAIESRGIAFRSTEQYRTLLITAGADAAVMDALKNAKISADATFPEQADLPEVLAHLTSAGKLIRATQFEEAGKEIVAALGSRITPEGGFLMGHLQDRMKEWENSATIYSKVIEMAPDFPGAHTRLAYDIFRLGDPDSSMREAQAALLQYKDDAEAHKNMGLAMSSAGKLDAAISEYREALRLKPDYSNVHYDLAIVYREKRQFDDAIVESKKAIVLSPNESDYHYNFGIILKESGDIDGAIRENREVKRIDPTRLDARQNLAAVLVYRDLDAAKTEFNELIAMAPDFGAAHLGLGFVFQTQADYKGAEKEYRKALALDPTDGEAATGIGDALEHQGRFLESIAEYRRALALNCDCEKVHLGLGRVYLDTKEYPKAVAELREAVNMDPSDWTPHSLLAQALDMTSNLDGAIAEARESVRVTPNNPPALLSLAKFLEKKGDLAGALEQCKLAGQWNLDPEGSASCAEIQKRNGVEVTSNFRPIPTPSSDSWGKTAAANLSPIAPAFTPRPRPTVALKPGETVDAAWLNAFNAGQTAAHEQRFADAEKLLEIASTWAEQLQPFNENALRTFDMLGETYWRDKKLDDAKATFQRELDLTEKALGPASDQNQRALSELATVLMAQKNYAPAEGVFLRLLDNSEKNYGPDDPRVTTWLLQLGEYYQSQKEYAKAEPYLLRDYEIVKNMDGDISVVAEGSIAKMQSFYIAWEKFDKAEPFCRKLLALRERHYGPDSKAVVNSIQTLADVLDKLGKKDEAAGLRKRSEAILGAGIPPKQQ